MTHITFHDRLATALRRRLFPNTGLQIKQVAGAIGQDGRNLSRWINGESKPFAEVIEELGRFFASRGDNSFIAECYGIETTPDLTGLRASIEKVLGRLPEPAPVLALTKLWFVDGKCVPSGAGHDQQVRIMMGLSQHVGGDLRASYCRNRGAVALEARHGGAVTIWHHATGADAESLTACRDWLAKHSADITTVRRLLQIEDTEATVDHEDAASAIAALDRLAHPQREATLPLKVDRLSLDECPAYIGRILKVHSESPEQVIPAAHDLGLMGMASILTVRGTAVTNDYLGPNIRFDRSDILGRNVLDRKESIYGATVYARAQEVRRSGPILTRITGRAYEQPLDYLSTMVPAGNSQILAIPHELEVA